MKIFHYILMLFIHLKWIAFIPHYVIFKCKKKPFEEDLKHWKTLYEMESLSDSKALFKLLINSLPYRNVFYMRMGFDSKLLSWYTKGLPGLHILMSSDKIGGGFVIWHGDATIIKAKSIGKKCEIWQNVTIGVGHQFDETTRPVIGDNVKICTGAIVCGNIVIGNNVIIGAGSVVFKSVPDNCVVIGNPAKIVKRIL